MNKKLFMLWTFLLCFLGGISAAEITIDANNSTFAADANGNIVATSGDVTFTYEKGGSSSDIAGGLQASELRVYKSSTFTVSSTKNITKIVFTTTKAANDADGFTTSTGTYTVDATNSLVGTWEGTSSSVTFEASGHQVRLSKIVVTLDESEAAVKTPVMTPAGGSYFGTQSITISCETADAKIYYTLDGNDPTAESTEYTAPVEITETATLKAIAIKGEDKSSIASASYTILANIANTVDAPMTVAEALAAIANNSAETLAHADNKVYVKGIVKYIDEISTSYGNATYSIVDAEGDADTLLIYRGKFLENAKFTAEDSAKFVPGSTVVIYGNLVNYNGTTPEMTAGNYLASFEEPKAEEATWKDIKVDLAKSTFIQNLTAGTSYKVGLVVNDDETVSAVDATDASADIILDGTYHNSHGWTGWTATVAVEGPVKVGIGQCSFGGGAATITDGEGKVVQFQVAKNGCYSQAQTAENISYGYYLGGATTLTIKYSSYTPYLSIEALTSDNLVTYYNEAYTTADASYSAFLVQEYNNGETITLPETNPEPALGYEFSHWATADGTEIKGGEPAADMNIYPVWKAKPVATITYSLDGSDAQGVLAVTTETVEQGQTITIPTNTSLYVEGKTLTGWTDGTNTYATGQTVTLNADINVTPVFTVNEVALADRTEEVTIKWNFRRDQGAAAVGFERNTGFVVAQAAVNGKTIDVKMDIDATSGKFNNKNHTDWCQVNPGTKFTMPSYKGAVVSLESMNATTTTTIEGSTEYTANGGTVSYTVQGTAETVEIVIGDATWYRSASVVLPAILPENITVDVTEGDIVAAVDAAKATVAKVGDITINLKEGVEYTLSSAIVAGAGGVAINGNNSVINASAELVSLPAEPLVAANDAKAGFYEISTPITIENVKVKTAKPIVKSNAKYLVSAVNVNNSIVELTGSTPIFDFSGQSGYPTVLSVRNSTFWSATSTNKPFFTSQSGHSPKDINGGAEETQTISIENSNIYNIATSKNFNELRQKGQKFLIFTIKNNIIINSGKDNFLQGIDGGQSSANPIWTVENNTFGKLAEGVFTDISAAQTGCGEVTNSITTDPMFADAANGDFTVFVGSQQAKFKTGDPRWLVEYDKTQALALPIVVDVTEGDILAAVDAAKATVDKVGDITINLKKDAAYTISKSIEVPANLVINGDSATVDASALTSAIVSLNGTDAQALNQDGTENAGYKYIDNISINNVVVNGLVQPIVKDMQKTLVGKIVVDNSVIEISGAINVFDFNGKGYPAELTVNKSTIWSKDGQTGYLLQAGGRVKDLDGQQAEFKQVINVTNSTLHKIASGNQFNNLRGTGQPSLVLTMTSSIISDCTTSGKEIRGWLGGQASTSPVVTYDKNTYWANGAVQSGWTSGSGCDATGTSLVTDPTFADAATGNFTLHVGTQQAKEKTGDPRWLVEFDETLSGIEGITTDGSSVNGANNDAWYNLQGVRVNGKPTQKGIYIHNGKKIVVK